jgi:hypothetical protein
MFNLLDRVSNPHADDVGKLTERKGSSGAWKPMETTTGNIDPPMWMVGKGFTAKLSG